MKGPCLCGDTHCPSCGPLQGNYRCAICRAWADDGCMHINEDGDILPQYQEEADKIARAENEMYDRLAKDLEEQERLAEEYWRSQ